MFDQLPNSDLPPEHHLFYAELRHPDLLRRRLMRGEKLLTRLSERFGFTLAELKSMTIGEIATLEALL